VRRSVLPAVVVAVALAGIVLVALASPTTSGDDRDPSSIGNGRAGTLALYTWLGSLGLAVQRDETALDLHGSDVLLSIEAETEWTSGDVDTLMQHLEQGGDAVVAGSDPSVIKRILDRFHLTAGPVLHTAAVSPLLPFDASGAVHSVPLAPGAGSASSSAPPAFGFVVDANPAAVPLLGDPANPVAVGIRVGGGGRLYLVGSVFPFSNDGLRAGDSAPFVLSLLERARGGHVTFDEFHHNAAAGSSFGIGAVFQGPLLLATGLVVAVLLTLLATTGRRLGRPLPARSAARVPSVLEDIDSMAQLFARSEQRGAVARRYAEELKQRLGGVTGADPRLADADFIAAVSGYGSGKTAAAAQLLAECRLLAAGRPTEPQLIALARRVESLEREWTGGLAV
jgi:hypothetical protein